MFISDAFATAAATPDTPALGGTFIQIALILLIFYFFLICPQQKRIQQHRAMMNALKIGDRVVTGGGIYGTVSAIRDNEISLEIAPGVNITVERMTIGSVVCEPEKKSAKKAVNESASKGAKVSKTKKK